MAEELLHCVMWVLPITLCTGRSVHSPSDSVILLLIFKEHTYGMTELSHRLQVHILFLSLKKVSSKYLKSSSHLWCTYTGVFAYCTWLEIFSWLRENVQTVLLLTLMYLFVWHKIPLSFILTGTCSLINLRHFQQSSAQLRSGQRSN